MVVSRLFRSIGRSAALSAPGPFRFLDTIFSGFRQSDRPAVSHLHLDPKALLIAEES